MSSRGNACAYSVAAISIVHVLMYTAVLDGQQLLVGVGMAAQVCVSGGVQIEGRQHTTRAAGRFKAVILR